jgi:prevent-host-death family protein
MREITALEASKDFESLLKQVEEGEVVLVSRDGRPVARITPIAAAPIAAPRYDSAEARESLAEIERIRERSKPVTIEEVLAWRDEGRK